MSHTYAQNVVHVVFSTKGRHQTMDSEFRPKLWAYVTGICRKLDVYVHSVGGMEDHLHLLIQIPPVLTLSKAVATIKANSSRWAKDEGHKFAWQEGYGAFSYSKSQRDTIIKYVMNQEEHHKVKSFKEEYLKMLSDFEVKYEERYLFEFYGLV